MAKPPMTSEDVQAMESARLARNAAKASLENALKEGKAPAEIQRAFQAVIEKQDAYIAFFEKHFQNYGG